MREATAFRASFPELEDAAMEWTEAAGGEERHAMSVKTEYIHGLVRCSNPACREGGFEIAYLVRRMVNLGQREQEGTLVCVGWEEENRPCINTFHYRVALSYKKRKA